MKSEQVRKYQHSSYFSHALRYSIQLQEKMLFLLHEPSCRQHTSWPPLEIHQCWGIEKSVVYIHPKSAAARNQKGWSEQGEGDSIISWANWILYVFLPRGSYVTQLKSLQITFSLLSFSVPSKDIGFWFARALVTAAAEANRIIGLNIRLKTEKKSCCRWHREGALKHTRP